LVKDVVDVVFLYILFLILVLDDDITSLRLLVICKEYYKCFI